MRHRRGALLLGAEWLTHLRDLAPLQVPDVGGEFFQAAGQHRERGEVGRVTVAGDHLGGDRRHSQAQLLQRRLFDARVDGGVRTDRTRQLAHADVLAGRNETLTVAIELIQLAGKYEAETHRLGVNAVGAARHQGVPLLDRPTPNDRRQPVDIL